MTKWQIVETIAVTLFLLVTYGWLFWRTLKKTEDPVALIVRWVLTISILGSMVKTAMPLIKTGGEITVLAGVLIAAASATVVGLLWARTWAEMIFSPITSMFDGGNDEPDPTPLYSSAEAKRQKGLYREAVQDIRHQLEKFPTDFNGHMLLARIQAEHLNDVSGAQLSLERAISQPRLAPANIAGALNQLADWHLKFNTDPEAARQALQEIVNRLPNTQFAQSAAQRIAHLPSIDQLLNKETPENVRLGHYEKYIGLNHTSTAPEPVQENVAEVAAKYVAHLQQHPRDAETREKLAVIYAEHYKRLDMARSEIETLISQPGCTARQTARWLNLLADLQVNVGNDVTSAAASIQRIEQLCPNTAFAEQAKTRLSYLKMEAKRHTAQQTVKLGNYEKDLGLKSARKGN